ncbi:MAG: hypothetical protein GC155_08330 [Alphaproteobacteria bacterium]|nr:hypothetical protein [Alphaproteobacteria bacterium]
MSRRPLKALASARLDAFSRRQLIIGGTFMPLAANGARAIDPSEPPCAEWLARHAERIRLIARWQALETHLVRKHAWHNLTLGQRRLLPQAEELDAIDDELDVLHEANAGLLASLPAVPAVTVPGLAAKLNVAAIEVRREENEAAHNLIVSIVGDFSALAPRLRA